MKKTVITWNLRNAIQNTMRNARFPILIFVMMFCILFFGCGCSNLSGGFTGALFFKKADKNEISIVSWNLQTFFDAVDSGTEYDEFTGRKSKWTEEKYKERLERLCTFMKAVNADIFCFMEVENTAVVQDIANTLQVGISGMSWQYVCFARESGSSLGCAVFSRYEPESLTVHSTDCRVAVQTEAFFGALCWRTAGKAGYAPAYGNPVFVRFFRFGHSGGVTCTQAGAFCCALEV